MYVQNVKPLPALWRGSAKVFAALGDESRQRILLMCGRKPELRMQDIFSRLPLSRTAVAHHVSVLREAGLLAAGKRGGEVYLAVNWETLRRAAKIVRPSHAWRRFGRRLRLRDSLKGHPTGHDASAEETA